MCFAKPGAFFELMALMFSFSRTITHYKKWGEACVGEGKGTLGLMSIPEAWPQLKHMLHV
jgi:hypothetical protein